MFLRESGVSLDNKKWHELSGLLREMIKAAAGLELYEFTCRKCQMVSGVTKSKKGSIIASKGHAVNKVSTYAPIFDEELNFIE